MDYIGVLRLSQRPVLSPSDADWLTQTFPCVQSRPAVQAMHFSAEHYKFLTENFNRYGDRFTFRIPRLPQRLILGNPEDIKVVSALKGDDLFSGDAGIMANLGERSVMFLDGAPHRRARALVAPPINGKTLDSYAETMLEITHDVIDSWQPGTQVCVQSALTTITLRIIGRCVLGFDDHSEALERVDTWLTSLSNKRLQMVGFMVGFNNMRRFLERKTFARLAGDHSVMPYPGMSSTAMKADIVRGLQADIEQCRQSGDQSRTDVLSLLAHTRDDNGNLMDVQDIIDQLILFFSAGHETTAKSSAWALNDILQRPDLMHAIQSEIHQQFDGVIDDPRQCMAMPLLNSVIKESMRLSPVTTMLQREITRPVQLYDLELPTGTTIAPCNFIAQRHPDYWLEPLTFMPERFIDFKPANEVYCPFGLGGRKCLGVSMAYLEMPIILTALLSRVEFDPLPLQYTAPEFGGITLAPEGGVTVNVRKIRPRIEHRVAAAV
ncbi:Putative cytochrome P450 135A1 [BD1-7 clade bacterium]|uniref:Cytochrome P450 135A1 n=1 Tax=BD1-7 clade bacterium TaxID=2029982 RepID=A0A5S9PEM3_9GAMM|nr:Putative cytochrome P450 135A1 [BD1-7 clade bacterium]CAA0102121.1 Putative cytochrome P450 135A1 [BD1-7 clade bacterium]